MFNRRLSLIVKGLPENPYPIDSEFDDKIIESHLFDYFTNGVGFCNSKEIKWGIFEYPLNSQKTDFLISYTKGNFKEIDHYKYLITDDFYCVSDIEPGPEGLLFVTDYTKTGVIYKIVPKSRQKC